MRYLGGKVRQAPWIRDEVMRLRGGRSVYVEPFVGGGSVLAAVAPYFDTARAYDVVPDLIMLWKAIQRGWVPPDSVTPELYESLRRAEPSALRGWAAYGCSFGGKWFAGYARGKGRDFPAEALRLTQRKARDFAHATFGCLSYDQVTVTPDCVVYCDPPYAGTAAYDGAPAFDSEAFWDWASVTSGRGALVLVTEFAAPAGWTVASHVWRTETVAMATGGARRENMYVHESRL